MDGRKVYIGNLEKEATKEEVDELFAKFGAVESVWIARKPAGFAFVVCDNPILEITHRNPHLRLYHITLQPAHRFTKLLSPLRMPFRRWTVSSLRVRP